MANSDRGVAVAQQPGHRDTYDVATAHHHCLRSLDFRPRLIHQHDDASRRAGHKERVPPLHDQTANVDRMETIHVLVQADDPQDRFIVQVSGQRQLHQDAINVGVFVQLPHQPLHLFLAGVLQQQGLGGIDTRFLAGPAFAPHVEL